MAETARLEAMPNQSSVASFVSQLERGDFANAIRDWYTEDGSMQENQEPPRVGRAGLIEDEIVRQARVGSVEAKLIGKPIIDGDAVVTQWRFTFTPHDSSASISFEQVSLQRWRGEQICSEQFVYETAQFNVLGDGE